MSGEVDETSLSGVLSGTLTPRSEDPPFDSLVDLLEFRFKNTPLRYALSVLSADKPLERQNYLDLAESARKLARRLAEAGVERGDRVLIILPTSTEFPAAFFGTLYLGAVAVPSAPPYSIGSVQLEAYGEALSNLVADCEPKVCVTTSRLAGLLDAFLSKAKRPVKVVIPSLKGPELPVERLVHPASKDIALIQYTSGSTSEPKGVVLTHGNLLANTGAIVHALVRHENDVTLSWLPLYHDMGLIGTLLTSIRGMVPVVMIPPQDFIKDPGCWLKAISAHKATISVAPNFAFGYCASRLSVEDLPGVRLDTVRTLLNGAEPIDVKLIERFEEKFRPLGLKSNVVRPVYGLAESALAVSFHRGGPFVSARVDADILERERRAEGAKDGARATIFVSVGRPIATQKVRVVNEKGRAVPSRTIGEITVKGPSVMPGYWQRPEQTAQVLKNGWLHTGDYGFVIADNVFITGRKKDLIIRRGRNYYPQDIEFQVSKVEGVRKGAVVAFAEDDSGDAEVVVVVETKLSEDKWDPVEKAIRDRVSRTFAFAPRDVVLVPPGTIPKTTSGKIRRNECRKRYLSGSLLDAEAAKVGGTLSLAVRSGMAYLKHWLSRAR